MKERITALVVAVTTAAITLTSAGASFAQTSAPSIADQGQAGSGSGQASGHHGHHHHQHGQQGQPQSQ